MDNDYLAALQRTFNSSKSVMDNEIFLSAEKCIVKDPEFSEWQCLIFGGTGDGGFRWRPLKGGEPNWFWRKMQYLILGSKWVKDPK